MNFNLVYGTQLEDNYLNAGEIIAKANVCKTSELISRSFFGGDVLEPKSFETLLSLYIPQSPHLISHDIQNNIRKIEIKKTISYCAFIGYIECIPVMGSALAALSIIYNLFGMLSSLFYLNESIKQLNAVDRTPFNVGRGASCHATDQVFKAAVNYTVHQNAAAGSLLAIIPFLKPITRVAQGIIFNLS